jgi:hypothetical protein
MIPAAIKILFINFPAIYNSLENDDPLLLVMLRILYSAPELTSEPGLPGSLWVNIAGIPAALKHYLVVIGQQKMLPNTTTKVVV